VPELAIPTVDPACAVTATLLPLILLPIRLKLLAADVTLRTLPFAPWFVPTTKLLFSIVSLAPWTMTW